MTIGVTGPSGAGKSVFCAAIAREGYRLLDCDEIYHGIVSCDSPCTRELGSAFGDVLNPDGSLDRRALSAVVFGDGSEEKLKRLNAVTHKYVTEEIHRIMHDEKDMHAGFLIDAPLLFQAGMDSLCGITVAILAPYEVRLGRIMQRDGLDEARARARLDSAPSDDWYRERCDCTVFNGGDAALLQEAAAKIIRYPHRTSDRKAR